ncbi:MAG: serpin family protein, partial [Planctomycetia bacterium]
KIRSPIRVDDGSIEAVLDLLCYPLDLNWSVRHGRLLITTQEEFRGCLFTEIYEVSDLTVVADTQGNKSYDLDSLIEVIYATIDPDSWSMVGGAGTIGMFENGNALVIRQTRDIQQEIAKLFADLRAAMPKDLAKRIPPVRVAPLVITNGFGNRIYVGRNGPPEEQGTEEKEKPKAVLTGLPPLDPGESTLVEANNAFAVKLYAQMAKMQDEKENGQVVRKSFCFSPYSIASLTQAVKTGTRGQTDKEIEKALCLTTLSGDALNRAHGSLLTSLMSDTKTSYTRALGGMGGYGGMPAPVALPHQKQVARPFELTIANRLWLQKEKEPQVLPEFLKTIEKSYLCGVEETNLLDAVNSTNRINQWVGEQTRERINKIISPDDINPLTRFVAVNAVFFQGKWKTPFEVQNTRPKTFYDSDGKTVLGTAQMMSIMGKSFDVGHVDGVSILSKAYDGDMSFLVLLPPAGKGELDKLESSLSTEKLRQWIASTTPQKLDRLELPKFKLESKFSMIPVMKQLGVNDLFNLRKADFSGMLRPDSEWIRAGFFVEEMRHKATIEVDEKGTVATAVTAMMGMMGGMMPKATNEFIADRPFLFMIVDRKTSTILFMGRYMGPDESEESVTTPVSRPAPVPRPRSRSRRGMGLF